jgi:hypothetical protein
MWSSLRQSRRALFLGGVWAGLQAAACSKPADRPADTETAASTLPDTSAAADRTAADSTAPTAASVAPSVAQSAARQDTPPKRSSVTQRPLPKPSIDPGRIPSKKSGDSTKAASGDTSSAAAGSQGQGLKYDAASNTVTFDLIAGPFNWNGFTNGGATLVLPSKANVVMNFVNKDGTPHSAEIISGEGPIPNAAGDPAIPRAYTNKALEGLPQEATDVMKFTVPESGKYRIFCGVPGHGLSGMWIWMTVDPAAKAPSFGPTKA